MLTVYAKLFSRITESSLMEESIPVRYTFVLLLAIADPKGYVIGTDVALARRLNMPLEDFQSAVAILTSPDPESNSKEEEGRRLVESDTERGYRIVNYLTYRDAKDADSRREYMREYMRKARGSNVLRDVNSRKHRLAPVAQAEAEAESKAPTPSPAAPPKKRVEKGVAPCTREEAYAYGLKIGMPKEAVDPWYDHFTANGWLISGKTPMKDWQAAQRNGKRMWQEKVAARAGKMPPDVQAHVHSGYRDVTNELPLGRTSGR